MKEYHKIQTVLKRDPETKFKTLLDEYACPEFEYLKDNVWVFTEKIDGTNIRVMYDEGNITIGGKTDNANIPGQLSMNLANTFQSTEMRRKFEEQFPDGKVCIYGEGYGGKIQKAGETYGKEQRFVVFDVKIGDWWLRRGDVIDIAERLDLEVVPIVGEGSLSEMIAMAKQGVESSWGNFQAEGIVARPMVELKTRDGKRIIAKIKTKDFKEVA